MRRAWVGLGVVAVALGMLAWRAWADDQTINGTMTMEQGSLAGVTGKTRSAGEGYDDISPGVTVKVRDGRDKVIGVGASSAAGT